MHIWNYKELCMLCDHKEIEGFMWIDFSCYSQMLIQIKLAGPEIEVINRNPNSNAFEATVDRSMAWNDCWLKWNLYKSPQIIRCHLIYFGSWCIEGIMKICSKQGSLGKLKSRANRIFQNVYWKGNNLTSSSAILCSICWPVFTHALLP